MKDSVFTKINGNLEMPLSKLFKKKKKEVEFGNSSYRNQILSDPDFIHKLKHMKELENSTILNRKT